MPSQQLVTPNDVEVSNVVLSNVLNWKIFELNQQINIGQLELNNLFDLKKNISSEINLLRDDNLDSDIISGITIGSSP